MNHRNLDTLAAYRRNIATMEVLEKICSTCLCADRNLYPLQQISTQLIYEFRLLPQDKVCWECRAQMIKFIQFRTKVSDAQRTIKMIVNGQMDCKAVKPLSSLSMMVLPTANHIVLESQLTPELKSMFVNGDQEPRLVEIKEDPPDIKTESISEEPYEESVDIFEAECEQYYQPSINYKLDKSNFTYNVDVTERDTDTRDDNCTNFKALNGLPVDKTSAVINETGCDIEENLMTKFTILKVNKKPSKKTSTPQLNKTQTPSLNALTSLVQSYVETQPVTPTTPFSFPMLMSHLVPQAVPKLAPMSIDATDRHSKKSVVKIQNAVSLSNLILEVSPLLPKLTPKPGLVVTPKPGLVVTPEPSSSRVPIWLGNYFETTEYPDKSIIVRDVHSGKRVDVLYSKRCTEEELAKQRQELREHIVFKSCPYKCETCIEYYSCHEKLQKHNEQFHKPENSFVCPTCAQRYPDEEELNQHKQLHYWNYICFHCKFTRHRKELVEVHYKRIHRRTDHECTSCGLVLPTFSQLKRHKMLTHRNRKYNCDLCAATFTTQTNLSIHLETHNNPKKPAEFKCIFCPKEFRGYKQFYLHVKSHKKKSGEPQYCVPCSKFFKTFNGYKQHMKTVHEPVQKINKYECDYCGAKFPSRIHIREHIEMTHCPVPKYPCKECTRIFKTVRYLQRHVRDIHKKKNEFRPLCDLCGKDFKNPSCLQQHKNSHHLGIRPYLCPFCDADFSYSGALYTHTKLKHKCKLPPMCEREKLVQERLAKKKQQESENVEKNGQVSGRAEKNRKESGRAEKNREENARKRGKVNTDIDDKDSYLEPRKRRTILLRKKNHKVKK